MLLLLSPPALARDEILQLDVFVNGKALNRVGEFILRDHLLFVRRQDMQDLGLRVPAAALAKSNDLVRLDGLNGIGVRLDKAAQSVHLTVPDAGLQPARIAVNEPPAPGETLRSATGALLNYDVSATQAGSSNAIAGSFEGRIFSAWGTASTSALVFPDNYRGGASSENAVRLDSTYIYADPATLRQYVAGDLITGGLAWTRPVRIGGIQLSSDFSLRPDLVTAPIPTLAGSAAVPSTLDVLVDGNKVGTRTVDPGPFEVTQLPLVSGAGTVSVALTDATGHQSVVSLPFYSSADLLAPGLQTYSMEAGVVRRNWGILSDDYGDLAGSATYRRGLSNVITMEAHAEGANAIAAAGAGLVASVANAARVNLTLTGSLGSGDADQLYSSPGRGSGLSVTAGMQHADRVFNAALSATLASAGYRDIAALNGSAMPRLTVSASAGVSFGHYGSAGLTFAGVNPGQFPPLRTRLPDGAYDIDGPSASIRTASFGEIPRARRISTSYSVQIASVSYFATGFNDFVRHGESGFVFGLTVPLGRSGSIGANASGGNGGPLVQLQAQKAPVDIGDWGYQASFDHGEASHGFAEGQYRSPYALLTAGVDASAGLTSVREEVEGSAVLLDNEVFAANRIEDSFGVIQTGESGNVRVTQENRPIGHTDDNGEILVPNLRSLQVNHIGIEPTDVAMDATLDTAARQVRPPWHSGVIINFPIRTSRGALLELVGEDGKHVPLGSVATLRASDVRDPVGFDGQVYVEGLRAHNTLSVRRVDGSHCVASFAYKPTKGEIPRIGPVACRHATG